MSHFAFLQLEWPEGPEKGSELMGSARALLQVVTGGEERGRVG